MGTAASQFPCDLPNTRNWSGDRLIFAGLYRLAPGILNALVIVKPETVIRWHRAGFRLALEVALSRRQTKTAARHSPIDLGDEPRQPALGRSPDPWRTPQARHQCGSNLGCQVLWQDTGNLHRICGRPLMASTIWCFERLGRLRSYVRPFGAERVSAGPDEVRQPGVTSRMRASRSCDGLGCSWSSVATVVIHHVFVALTKL